MVVDTKLYDILGVSPSASDSEIKKAFHKKALQLHPDQNRSDPKATEKFQELNEAYEILKDPSRRQTYDRFGPDGLRGSGSGGLDDIINRMFGGGGGGGGFFGGSSFFGDSFFGGGQQRRPRTQDIGHIVKVNLEDFYNGKEVTLRITRDILCPECGGSGCQKGKKPRKCSGCDGKGRRVGIQRMGNMITQQIVACPDCAGQGETADPKDRCKKCNGKKVCEEKKTIIVHVEPGMEAGEQIRFREAADQAPGADTGDVIVKLDQRPHEHFIRRGDDLLTAKKITLSQALLGATFVLTHLDGRKLVVSSSPGQVINPDSVKVIEREGMPHRGNIAQKGRLFVKFEVEFPKASELTPELRAAFTSVLGVPEEASKLNPDAEDIFPVVMQDGDVKQFENAQSSREKRGEAYSQENDEETHETSCHPI
jgi:DnaJ-class molecular chaperone